MRDFLKEDIVPMDVFQQITDVRVNNPEWIPEIAKDRRCRKEIAPSGKLNIVAADHPARGSISVGDDSDAMGDRHDLLARIVYVLHSDWTDGVLGSMDLLEELLILNKLMSKQNEGFLDYKVMIASLNRGGYPGAAWELNDPVTGPDAAACRQMNLDGAKMLFRMDPSSNDSLLTLKECVRGVRDMSREKLPIFLEPLPVQKTESGYRVITDPDLLSRMVGLTSALGSTSRYTWLKLPVTENFEKVVQATTLPIVILGGSKSLDIEEVLTRLDAAVRTGHQVRGAMFGRNLLFPDAVDSLKLSDAIGKLLHGKQDIKHVLKDLGSDR